MRRDEVGAKKRKANGISMTYVAWGRGGRNVRIGVTHHHAQLVKPGRLEGGKPGQGGRQALEVGGALGCLMAAHPWKIRFVTCEK